MLITKLQIIDTATGQMLAEFKNGDMIFNSVYPRGYTISPQFSDHFRAVQFQMDGLPPVTQMAPPYLVNDKHPPKPLNLPIGPHRIGVIVDGVPLPDITFSVALAPPPPSPTRKAIIGTNLNGFTNPVWNAGQIAKFVTGYKATGFNGPARAWGEIDALKEAIRQHGSQAAGFVAYAAQMKAIHDAGIPVWFQIQYVRPAFKMYSLADQQLWRDFLLANPWIAFCSAGNEVDSGGYFDDGLPTLKAFTQTLQPIRANTKLIMASRVHGLANIQAAVAAGEADGTDGVDQHIYGNLLGCTQAFIKFTDWCASNNLNAYSSEFGVIQDPPMPAVSWAQAQGALLSFIKPLSITAMQYPYFPIAGPKYDATVADGQLNLRQPYQAAYKQALA